MMRFRRIPICILLALFVIFCLFPSVLADSVELYGFEEEFGDFGEFGQEETGGPEEFNFQAASGHLSELSGYHDLNILYDGDFGYYVSDDGTYCVTGLYCGSNSDVNIPSVLGGYPVRAIGPLTFNQQMNIESVIIPDGVCSIGKQAFFMCVNLRTVTIPEGVYEIGDQCFAGCYVLDVIKIPDSVETIGEMAFLGCKTLQEISFGPHLKKIGSCAFHTCEVLEKVVISSENVEIGEDAFYDCPDSLELIYLDESSKTPVLKSGGFWQDIFLHLLLNNHPSAGFAFNKRAAFDFRQYGRRKGSVAARALAVTQTDNGRGNPTLNRIVHFQQAGIHIRFQLFCL